MDVEKAKEMFQEVIVSVLGGPGGDPEPCNYEAAASAVAGLVALGERAEDISDYAMLKGDNMYETDFMEAHGL